MFEAAELQGCIRTNDVHLQDVHMTLCPFGAYPTATSRHLEALLLVVPVMAGGVRVEGAKGRR